MVLLGPATQRLWLGSRTRVVVWDWRCGSIDVECGREEELEYPHADSIWYPGPAAPWSGDHGPDTCPSLRVICALLLDILAINDIPLVRLTCGLYVCEHSCVGGPFSAF